MRNCKCSRERRVMTEYSRNRGFVIHYAGRVCQVIRSTEIVKDTKTSHSHSAGV